MPTAQPSTSAASVSVNPSRSSRMIARASSDSAASAASIVAQGLDRRRVVDRVQLAGRGLVAAPAIGIDEGVAQDPEQPGFQIAAEEGVRARQRPQVSLLDQLLGVGGMASQMPTVVVEGVEVRQRLTLESRVPPGGYGGPGGLAVAHRHPDRPGRTRAPRRKRSGAPCGMRLHA